MENKIPVPTDNIFKFYALFGLLLFIFSLGSVLYVTKTTNEVIYATKPELAGLKQSAKPSAVEAVRIALLEKRLEITLQDKDFYLKAIGVLLFISLVMMIVGFVKWHRGVQRLLDETAAVQLDIARLHREKLRREMDKPHSR